MRALPVVLKRQALLVVTFPLFIILSAGGQVSLDATYYNSDGSLSEDISVENAGYSCNAILYPYDPSENLPSISSAGAGGTIDPSSSKFSHSTTLTTREGSETIFSSVKTQSGGYNWRKSAQVSLEGSSAQMSVEGGINSGNLEAYFGNSDSSLNKEVNAKNFQYSFAAFVAPELVISRGAGHERMSASFREPPSNREVEFSSNLVAENLEKRVTMEADLRENILAVGDVDYTWSDRAELSSALGSMATVLDMEAADGWVFTESYIPRHASSTQGDIPNANRNSIIAGMEFNAQDMDSMVDLFETRYVPEAGELSINLRRASQDVREIVRLSMSTIWKPTSQTVTVG